jgi:sulfur dioxygenase
MHINPIQLFDAESSTCTYILSAANGEAAIIDPVERHCERDLAHLRRLGLRLAYALETHAHADHVTSSGRLRELTGALACAPSGCGIAPADRQLEDGETSRSCIRPDIRQAASVSCGAATCSRAIRC